MVSKRYYRNGGYVNGEIQKIEKIKPYLKFVYIKKYIIEIK